ncbi:MAG: peptidoglycan-binding protein [Blastocatellia bacterium]|nr:peptidoglycan-binding protein [Blastocatellia bacterium]MBL8196066.1 peptidoglycan-binding protein [Blastocatellia bacterium]
MLCQSSLKIKSFCLVLMLIFSFLPLNISAQQQRPKLSRNSANERSEFRFKVSVLVSRNKDSYLYSYTLEQLDNGRLNYKSIERFRLIFPCGEKAYKSIENLESDGWQVSESSDFYDSKIGKGKLSGLEFSPTYPIIPNGDATAIGDKSFGFSFTSKCAPTRGQWKAFGEGKEDLGEIDVPCGCNESLSSNNSSIGDRGQSKSNPPKTLPIPQSQTSNSNDSQDEVNKTSNKSIDDKITVTRKEIIISPDTILKLRMKSELSSATAKIGDKFEAELFEDVKANQLSVLPAGCTVIGRVISVEPAKKGNKSGTIGINFERLVLPSKRAISVVGELTSLNKDESKIDSEGHVEGSSGKRTAVFIGGGAAGGAAIGAIAGGGKGAGIGAAIGVGAGVLGVLLTKGQEAIVKPGTEFGLLLTQPLRIANANLAEQPKFSETQQDKIFTDSNTIYQAQVKLKELGYLNSIPRSRISPSVKRAIISYQNDNNLRPTGLIDYPTALSLGIIDNE